MLEIPLGGQPAREAAQAMLFMSTGRALGGCGRGAAAVEQGGDDAAVEPGGDADGGDAAMLLEDCVRVGEAALCLIVPDD
jgi:hypothetical protein